MEYTVGCPSSFHFSFWNVGSPRVIWGQELMKTLICVYLL